MKYLRLTIFILPFLIFCSCSKPIKNKTPEEFANTIFKILQSGDTSVFTKKLLIQPGDSLKTNSARLRSEIHSEIGSDEGLKKFRKEFADRLNEFLVVSEELGIDWHQSKLDSISYKKRFSDEYNFFKIDNFKAYITSKGRQFRFHIKYLYYINDELKGFQLDDVIDIKKEIERLENENFTPGLVYISSQYNWRYKYGNLNSFSEFYINIVNDLMSDISSVKYKITIKKKGQWLNEEVFSKTFEYNQKIYSENKIRVEIEELRDFYIGVDVSDDENFFMESEIIDVRPHPQFRP